MNHGAQTPSMGWQGLAEAAIAPIVHYYQIHLLWLFAGPCVSRYRRSLERRWRVVGRMHTMLQIHKPGTKADATVMMQNAMLTKLQDSAPAERGVN